MVLIQVGKSCTYFLVPISCNCFVKALSLFLSVMMKAFLTQPPIIQNSEKKQFNSMFYSSANI